MKTGPFPILGLIACLLVAAPAAARKGFDQDAARAAVLRGEILPLGEILAIAEAEVAGRVIEVELDKRHGRFIYEFEFITPEGQLIELEIDARSGEVLDRELELR
ncbi:PepSY domain-containing protein [Roseibium aggregatum]|uniref:PepSY domain-containing protein n=1 Tax=Roseibium aggregatum TaxID=187304 RepID=A0A939J593_9HYPH|nr:PepSY domain-containing protein [Roseibium aggregatum]MBN9672000.1 PepSY domain-containing protein [Roseibium aggregatum]